MVDTLAVAVPGVLAIPRSRAQRAVLFVVWLPLGLLAFAILPLSSSGVATGLLLKAQGGISAAFLAAALLSRRAPATREYASLLFVHFVASLAVLLSTLFGGEVLEMIPLRGFSPAWVAIAKLSESIWRVVPLLLLMAAGGASLRSIYLARGRLGLGLYLGALGFAVCATVAVQPFLAEGGLDRLWPLLPWTLIFVLANGFTEELLFRGLFLQRLEPLLGKGLSNLLTATTFTALHVSVRYVANLEAFLAITFVLALAWGYLMQRTGSLWGSALFHAGADTLVIFGIFNGG